MGFLCNTNNNDKLNVSQKELQEIKFLRDVGLDNVNNVNGEIIVSSEIFVSPEFYVSGASKLICTCPQFYTLQQDGTCINIDTVPANAPNSAFIFTGRTSGVYTGLGTRFYDSGYSFDGTGTFYTSLTIPLWWNDYVGGGGTLPLSAATKIGPMNRSSLWVGPVSGSEPPFDIWVGFSFCLNNATVSNKTYYVGLGADNDFKLSIDGVEVLNTLNGPYDGSPDSFYYWHTYPITITPGNHIFELYGLNRAAAGAFGCEIYDNTLSELTGATAYSGINVIFTTADYIGQSAEFYQTLTGGTNIVSGYTCPTGYLLSSCNNPYVCVKQDIIDCPVWTPPTGSTTGSTGLYNLNYTPDFNLGFILSTGTTEYTGYTGYFGYKIFSNEYFTAEKATGSLSNGSEILDVKVPFSNITGGTFLQNFLEGNLKNTWTQYLIRPYFIYESKQTGQAISTWNDQFQPNSFQGDTDFYFFVAVDPPTPVLNGPTGQPLDSFTFIQDVLLSNGVTTTLGPQASVNNVINYFILKKVPIGDILLFINGVRMTIDSDYKIILRGLAPPVVEIQQPISITDWVVANYFVGVSNPLNSDSYNKFFVDTFIVNAISIDATVGYVNQVNVNTTSGNYEIYVDRPVDNTSSIYLSINGIELVQNQDFFLSTSQDNRIIINKTYTNPINLNDVISIFASSPNIVGGTNYGSIAQDSFLIQWTVPSFLPNNTTGRFIVQVADINDSTYTNVLYEKTLSFVDGTSAYQTTITSITLNQYYRFKVIYEATHTAYLNKKVITSSYVEGTFDTTSAYINNTY